MMNTVVPCINIISISFVCYMYKQEDKVMRKDERKRIK